MSEPVFVPYRYEKTWVIYDADRVAQEGHGLTRRVKAGLVCLAQLKTHRLLGWLLLAISALITASYLFPVIFLETRYRLSKTSSISQKHSLFGELLWLEQKGVISPADWQFSLIIPKVGLNTKVISEVDAANEAAYKEALKKGLAHAKGSSFPDQEGMVYIFGHSTDFAWNVPTYNALFYLLGKLKEGDEVAIFYQGRHYVYQVSQKEVVTPDDLSSLENFGEKRLVLSTCWPPGTTWQRLIVTALPEERVAERVTFNQIP